MAAFRRFFSPTVIAGFWLLALFQSVVTAAPTASFSGNLDFGSVEVGNSAQSNLTITNSGDATLVVGNVLTPTGFSANFTGNIAPGGSQNVTITFTPASAIAYAGNLTVNSNTADSPQMIPVTGTGVPSTLIAIIAVSGNIAFGNVTVNTTSQRTLSVSNLGNTTLHVANLTIPSGFQVTNFNGNISPGGLNNATVVFAPTAVQSYSGTIVFTSNAASGTNSVGVSGTGTAAGNSTTRIIALSGNLSFGNVTIGQSAQSILTITNSGTGTLGITNITYPNPVFSGNLSGPIAAGSSANVTVTFTPTASTFYNGTLSVAANSTAGGKTMLISGLGVAAQISLNASGNLSFGNVAVGASSQKTLTIHNTGSGTVTVTSLSLPAGFNGNFSGNISVGASQNVGITFSPASSGNYGGSVTVNSNATSGTTSVTASGTGVNLPLLALTGNLSFGSVTVGASSQHVVTISNVGTADLQINSLSCLAPFSVTNYNGILAPNATQNITVTFAPVSARLSFGNLTVSSNDTSSSGLYAINGTGVVSADKTAWLQLHFSPAQLSNSSISGDQADPDGDGLSNLMEYAFDTNPWGSSVDQLPQPTVVDGQLTLVFQELRSGISYTVQYSTDLVNWSTDGVVLNVSGNTVTAQHDLEGTLNYLRITVAPQ
jgi:hypothetical protein